MSESRSRLRRMFILLSFSTRKAEVDMNCCDVVRVRRPKLCSMFGQQDLALGRDELSESRYHPKLDP